MLRDAFHGKRYIYKYITKQKKQMTAKNAIRLTALLALLSTSAQAAESAEDEQWEKYTTREITVSGKKGDILQRVAGKDSIILNPSQMSVYKAINLMPSLSQQSVDPYGLADIVNYHESFRFRGVEATAGGVPATTANVEGLPVTGRPGGGATIYDLENISDINIYTGVMPAYAGLGLADVGGKIDMKIRRPEETFGVQLKQSIGSNDYSRTYLRVDSGTLPGKAKAFLSFSETSADKWKGEGDSERKNLMGGITAQCSDNVKLETFLIWSKGDIHTCKPFTYAEISNLEHAYETDYGTEPGSYDYYGWNRNEFEDWMLLADLEIKTGERSKINIKPYYWSDKGYYHETISTPNGKRIRRWDIDHDLKGLLGDYNTKVGDVDLDLGYLYHTQKRPGPPTSWKNYTVSASGDLNFAGWNILSLDSSHELHTPFIDAVWHSGDYQLEAGLKYVCYALPSIITYKTKNPDIGDIRYHDALALDPAIDTDASALDARSFNRLFPNLTLTRFLGDSASIHASYGENYVTHVDIYPYYISQRAQFQNKGVTFQELWDKRQMEISRNMEIGMRLSGRNWSLEPTVYYSLHKNKQAVLYDTDIDAYYPMNEADAEGYGIELEAEYKPLDNLKCYTSLSWNRFSFTQDIYSEGGSLIEAEGDQVPDAPEFLAKAILSWKIGDFTISPVMRCSSARYGDLLHKEKIDGATLFDLDLTWSRAMLGFKQVDCSLSLLNIFDEHYVSMINTSDYKTLKTSYQPGAPFTMMATIALHY
jgi:iron complex outermembrane receptor protein